MDWKKNKTMVVDLLSAAGITINGSNPWDIQIYNEDFYTLVLRENALGLGESYMDHWWDCQSLDQFFDRILRARIHDKIKANKRLLLKVLLLKALNLQTQKRAFIVAKKHYDLGNDLFQNMLDSRMNYTCGYWKNANNLENAQINKLELTCQKLILKPGMRLLDIGCGWGALAKYAAENFGVTVIGVTISKEQAEYARNLCQGLPVEIRLKDYRDIHEKFDRVASLGMFEHVGHLNYRSYMEVVRRCLTPEGLFLLHTIGSNFTLVSANEWISKYIFPNGMIPSVKQIGKAYEGLLVMEDWHNFGSDYDKTLMAWQSNFSKHWTTLKPQYDERFYRMWNYYLLSCAGSFRARDMQLWQIVFSKSGVPQGYQAPRQYFQITDQMIPTKTNLA
jgi:cyclopropane-fatty-acyl-phospholipid synthase